MTAFSRIGFTDIDGLIRGKIVPRTKLESNTTLGFCNVVFGWDINDALYPFTSVGTGQNGFRDAKLQVDIESKRTIAYNPNYSSFYFSDFSADPHLAKLCPRSMLKALVKDLEEKGIKIRVGFEYEWIFWNIAKSSSDKPAIMSGYSSHQLAKNEPIISTLLETCEKAGISIYGLHTETGPGAMECALSPKDPIRAVDDAILFKQIVKDTYQQYGCKATFMAKTSNHLPGSGGHIHLSLSKEGTKLFGGTDPSLISKQGQAFVAGILDLLPDMMLLYAPNVNSYKRYVKGSWAPTTNSWGMENRTTAIRYISDEENSRIEFRVPGADANPYLCMLGLLLSGIYGLENSINLAPITKGNAYLQDDGTSLPGNLNEAALKMRESSKVKELLNPSFHHHFTESRLFEWHSFSQQVTEWEKDRYGEIL